MRKQTYVWGGGAVYFTKEGNKKLRGCLLILKKGLFYNVFGQDAKVINYFLKYKISINEVVAFPEEHNSKVINILKRHHISFQINSKKDEIGMICLCKYNNYDEYVDIALANYNINKKIDDLVNKIYYLDNKKINYLINYIEDFLKNEK